MSDQPIHTPEDIGREFEETWRAIRESRRKEVIGDVPVVFIGDERMATIYGVTPEKSVGCFYIGSTTQPLKSRIRAHILDARNGSTLPFHRWIMANVHGFRVTVLEVVPAPRREVAERKWIATIKPPLNLTDGGPGMSGHKFAGTEHAKRIAASIRSGAFRDCIRCGARFWRKRNEIAKGNDKFCSRACSNTRHKDLHSAA